jgi:hypothetical protein
MIGIRSFRTPEIMHNPHIGNDRKLMEKANKIIKPPILRSVGDYVQCILKK